MITKIVPGIFIVLLNFWSNNIFSQSFEIDDIIFKHTVTKTYEDVVLLSIIQSTKGQAFYQHFVNDDMMKLTKFYFDNGFFEAIIDSAVGYNEDDQEAIITYSIRENRRYRIDTLRYIGLENVSPELSQKISGFQSISKNKFYEKSLILKQTNEIVDLLQNNGYMNAGINQDSGTLVYKYDSTVTVQLNFTGADTIYRFGKTRINITDNKYDVNENIIRKAITYNEGDIYSKTEKLNTEKYITNYAIVQSARLIQDSTSQGFAVDFIANIVLNNKHDITPSIGAQNIDNYIYAGAELLYENKNFKGGGRVLSVDAVSLFHSPKIYLSQLSLTVTQPYLFNYKTSLKNKTIIGYFREDIIDIAVIGNTTTLDYFIADHTFYNNVSFELTEELVWLKLFIEQISLSLTGINSLISATITHDNTNSFTYPTKGFFHSILAGEAGLFPKIIKNLLGKDLYYYRYVKLFTANRVFFSLDNILKTSVIAAKFNVGDIIEYDQNDKVLPVQADLKFFSGGSNSLRGWNPKTNGVLEDTRQGGKFIVEGSLEFRKKLFPFYTNFLKDLQIAVFLDYGNVWVTQNDFRFKQIALAAGFGFRYDLFFGPVRIDFGWKLYNPTDREGDIWLFDNPSRIFKDKLAFNFGIGQAF